MNPQNRVMSAGEIAAHQYFSGSGADTVAHLKQNERITVLSCAVEGPLLLRICGQGPTLETGTQSAMCSTSALISPSPTGFPQYNDRRSYAYPRSLREYAEIGAIPGKGVFDRNL
jgi:hypothetical protein